VKRTPTIASTADIERMKAAVSKQMYAALAQIGLLAVGPVAYAVGLFKGALEPSDIVFIILPSAAVLAVAAFYKRVETAAKTIEVSDDELRRQRDAIVRTWLKKPFPDW
jgi:membrane protein implicated in regulation of membrane protease activity